MPSGPKYPNQQLRSVSLEAHFPGRLGVYARMGELQAAVEHELPNLYVPNIQPGEAAALRPFQLRDGKQRRSLAVAINQATYIAFEYPGHESFIAEAVAVLSRALGCIEVPKLNRVVYRYENEVGIARDTEGGLAIEPAFPGVIPAVFAGQPARALNAAFEHSWSTGAFRGVRGFHARFEEGAGAGVLGVSVFGTVEGCEASQLGACAAEAHRVGVDLFESLISPKFRDFISSDGKE